LEEFRIPSDMAPGKINNLIELARIAGVSTSTVSRALSGKGALNDTTRQRIRAIAERHGFQVDAKAQNLRLGRTGTIGIILPLGHEKEQHVSDPFFMAILALLADEISDRGYDLLFRRIDPEGSEWLNRILETKRVDGLLIIGQSDQGEVLERVGKGYKPLAVWGQGEPNQSYTTVGVDNVAGGRLAAKHLLERGRTRLAYFGNVGLPEFRARYDGFLSALPAHVKGMTELVSIHMTSHASHAAALDFLRDHPDTDGIFAASDVTALSVIRGAVESGRRVPEDISVIGFDDVPLAGYSNPPLTTIRQDLERGARAMCDIVFARLDGETRNSVRLSPELIVRASS